VSLAPATFVPWGVSLGKTKDFILAQSITDSLVSTFPIRSIGVFNLTPFFIHFPSLPAAFQWVAPNTKDVILNVPAGQNSIPLNSVDVPTGQLVQAGSQLTAAITIFEDMLPPSPGSPFGTGPNIVPNKVPIVIAQVIASGATFSLVAGVPGQSIYLFGCVINNDTAGANQALDLQDSTGVSYHEFTAFQTYQQTFNGAGIQVPVGRGVQLLNRSFGGGSGNLTIRGSVVYSQA